MVQTLKSYRSGLLRLAARSFARLISATVAICVAFATLSSMQASANDKNHEKYFMSRARYAANVVCTKKNPQSGYEACFKRQMGAARRIVERNQAANSERMLKKTMECLQTVQVLPVKLRRKGLLWVENCIR